MSLLFGYSSNLETIEEDIDMNGNKIIDLPSPTSNSEPVTKGYGKETRETSDCKDHRDLKVTTVREDLRATPVRKV